MVGNFLNEAILNFLEAKGIQSKVTYPHSFYQNGFAERTIRTLQDKARTLLAHGNVPLIFWPDAIRMACHLLNWTPRASLGNKTPEEVWYGYKPTSPVFHSFGCVAYAHFPTDGRPNKMGQTNAKCAYLGPSPDRTGHILFTFDPPQVFDSNQVKFCDTQFYFHQHDVSEMNCERPEINISRIFSRVFSFLLFSNVLTSQFMKTIRRS